MPQKVLIIDDSPAIHALLRARLKEEHVVLYSAGNGEQGLAMASELIPDLILLDVDMPATDGFEVCRRLKLDANLVQVPVIFLTGAATTEELIQGLELGAVDYITKPFEPAELRARVRAALRIKFLIDLLAKKAQIDALTGLWNRRYFDQRLEAEVSLSRRTARPLAVLMLDIDRFKRINDDYGHHMGDDVLRRLALLLSENVRAEDVVCRYGGEEFAIITPNTAAGAVELAERLRGAVEHMKITHSDHVIPITVSIGVAASTDTSHDNLVELADAALYRAKQTGRNRVADASAEASLRQLVWPAGEPSLGKQAG